MRKKQREVFVILDAHALIHRAFHALPPLTSPTGEPVGAVYGFASFLFKLVREFEPTYIAAAFDRPEPTFRHKAYADYKATRAEVSPDIIPQFDKTKDLLGAFHVAVYECAGYEADDVIGTIVEKLREGKAPVDILIASGDMDTVQLINGKSVRVYTMRKGITDTIVYDEETAKERLGFGTEHLIDYKGLRGDASDNIKGVPGIGEKTAQILVSAYGSLENIYDRLEEIEEKRIVRPSVIAALRAYKKDAFFSRDLARIHTDVPIPFSLEESRWDTYDKEKVVAFLRALDFASLINRIPGNGGGGISSSSPQTELFSAPETVVDTNSPRDSVVEVSNAALVGVLKTASREKRLAWLLSPAGVEVYMGAGGEYFAIPQTLCKAQAKKFSELLTAKTIEHIGFATKPLLKWLWDAGVSIPNFAFDVAIAAWVLDPTIHTPHIPTLSRLRLKIPVSLDRPREVLVAICKLADVYKDELATNKLASVFEEIEMPLIPVLASMERVGVRIDKKLLETFSNELARSLQRREKKIYKLAGIQFNINSPKQLSDVLFRTLGIATAGVRKTEGGEHSTRAAELAKLTGEHPLIDEVLKYREEMKLKSTYVDVLPKLAEPETGRIHTTFNQTGTVTGRLSSQDPNIQNIPARTALGQTARKAFVAEKGYELVSFDYSQIELRLAAAFANDKKMIKAFEDGEDIHTLTAAEINGVSHDAVTPSMRRAAKTINFGVLYGMGATSLAESLGISRSEAQTFIANYFAHFPRIRGYIDRTKRLASKEGYVETISGRRRYFGNLENLGWQARRSEERMAVNAPIQGSEADIIKRAMVVIATEILPPYGDDVRMMLQVHDELLFEMKKGLAEKLAPAISYSMENIYSLSVPIRVAVKKGPNWQDMKPL